MTGRPRDEVRLSVSGRSAFVSIPVTSSRQVPWVWYAPTFLSGELLLPDKSHEWLFEQLLDKGIAVAGIDVGDSYGSPVGVDAFAHFHMAVTERFGLADEPVLLAQSRGALMHYAWAARHAERVRAIACIYPVCDLRSYPGIVTAASAYGLTPRELENDLARHNPLDNLEAIAAAGVPIFHLHGDADDVVPLQDNTAALASRYRELGGHITIVTVPGLGHEYPPCPEFFESNELASFIDEHSELQPVNPLRPNPVARHAIRTKGREGAMAGTPKAQSPEVPLPTIRPNPFDPPADLATLRDRHPVCPLRYPDGHLGWLVTSHELGRELLADSRFSIRPQRPPVGDPAKNAEFFEASATFPHNVGALIELDPPQHTRIRRFQTGYFTVRRVSEKREAIQRIANLRLDAIDRIGPPVDLVENFCLPFSSLVLCELLGVPEIDRANFERPNEVIQDPATTPSEKMAALNEFTDYCREVIEQKRARPADDLLSELVASGDLTDMELVGIALQLFSAGHETTAHMLGMSVFALLSDRDRWQELRRRPDLVESAAEELLRYITIAQLGAFTRTALEDVELNGRVIKQGQGVTVSLSAANRDPRAFPDPDMLELRRNPRAHLSFGHGRHMCLGQHLARLELQVALAALVGRLPAMRLAVSAHDVPLLDGEKFLHGARELLVSW